MTELVTSTCFSISDIVSGSTSVFENTDKVLVKSRLFRHCKCHPAALFVFDSTVALEQFFNRLKLQMFTGCRAVLLKWTGPKGQTFNTTPAAGQEWFSHF